MQNPKNLSQRHLESICGELGLSVVALTQLTPLSGSVKALNAWQEAGFSGAMGYMQRSAEMLCEPQKLLPEGRSAAVFSIRYSQTECGPTPKGFGRVARYAWGKDYHHVLKSRLEQVVAAVEVELGRKISHRIFSDSVPLLERALAERSGVGFIGKNTMLITPGVGSFFFLSEILWDVEIATDSLAILSGTCGACSRCIDNCPTSAIVGERVLDARRCISYLSIEKRDSLTWEERRSLGEWIFGCDVCQDVCPFNHTSLKEGRAPELAEFSASEGVGPFLSLAQVLRMRREDEFRKVFSGTALLRTKRRGLLRNAACVAANTLAEEVVPILVDTVKEDPDPVIRQHAIWALYELSRHGASVPSVDQVAALARSDPDAIVQAEARQLFS
jgi:epoxyqueuosine reductase